MAVAKHLMERKSPGSIVMIGSMSGAIVNVPQPQAPYNASKAAVLSYADTLRVEMAPFGVSVITIMTGGVKSELTKKVQRFIPSESLYSPIEEHFNRRKTHSAEVGMSPEQYADHVVRQILPSAGPWPFRWLVSDARRRWIWAGSGSSLVWLLSGGWWKNGLFDWYFTRKFKLDQLRQPKVKSS